MDQREENIEQIYDGYPSSLCNKTRSPEKSLCLNMKCKMEQKLHCCECLLKEHSGKNDTVTHLSEFLDVDKFMSKIAEKIEKKEQIYNKLIDQCYILKKQKIEKIERDVQNFILNLTNEKEKNNRLKKYQKENHKELLSLYFEEESTCAQKLTIQKQNLEQQVKQHINNFLSDTEMQLQRQIQSDLHESQGENKIVFKLFNKVGFKIYFILILMVSLFCNLYQYTKEELNLIKEQQVVKNYNLIISLLGEIHVDLPVSKLNYFTLISNFSINNSRTTESELKKHLDTLNNTNSNHIICIGVLSDSYSNHFDLAACDYASEVFALTNSTKYGRKSYTTNIYWYWISGISFGFSPVSQISLNHQKDTSYPKNRLKLSLPLFPNQIDNSVRLGNKIVYDSKFMMRIYMYKQ